MAADLKDLRIDRDDRHQDSGHGRTARIGAIVLVLAVLLFGGGYAYTALTAPVEVEVVRVRTASSGVPADGIILNATGYIVAAHKIEVGSKVVGRVAWIGVDKGDKVRQGDILVRLEDEE